MNSISGLVFFVKDLNKTVKFYEKVGFHFKQREPNWATAYLNWFWMEFVAFDKAEPTVYKKQLDKHQGSNLLVHISVQNVDEFYDNVMAKGLKPSSAPQDFHWGRREFVIRDPDGYKIVFFQKI